MGERKFVSRKVAFGIAAVCIALLIIMGEIVANYTSTLSTISSLQKQLASDNSEINSLNTEISSLQTLVKSENSTIAYLQNSALATEMANLQTQISLLETEALGRALGGFSVVQITDTQYLSDSTPDLFNGLTSWIVGYSQALNVTMVIHTGDIVQVAGSTGDWDNANNAMSQLYNNGVPYCWDAGNHDQLSRAIDVGNPNGSWLGGKYPAFNVTIMRQKAYWVGDIFDGKNTAVKFTYYNYHFMVINVEYDANQTVLDWMQTLLKSNPNVNVIVATHNFLNGDGGFGRTLIPDDVTWATNFENLLNHYPNVFMTVSGHCFGEGGSAYNKKVGNREEIYFNMQENDSKTGAATARIYTFNMQNTANPVVTAFTFQTFGTPRYVIDPKDQFSFSTSLTAY